MFYISYRAMNCEIKSLLKKCFYRQSPCDNPDVGIKKKYGNRTHRLKLHLTHKFLFDNMRLIHKRLSQMI